MTKINIGISGCLGKMGRELVKEANEDKRINFVGGFDLKDRKSISNDVFHRANVVIDFSSPAAIKENLNLANFHRTALIIGTTGLKQNEIKLLKLSSKINFIFFN